MSGGGGSIVVLSPRFATMDPSVITWGVNCRGVNCRGVDCRGVNCRGVNCRGTAETLHSYSLNIIVFVPLFLLKFATIIAYLSSSTLRSLKFIQFYLQLCKLNNSFPHKNLKTKVSTFL